MLICGSEDFYTSGASTADSLFVLQNLGADGIGLILDGNGFTLFEPSVVQNIADRCGFSRSAP